MPPAAITQTLTDWITQHGVYAIFVVMAVDALLPAGGELTMLVAGALAAGAIAGRHPVLLGHTLPHGLGSYVVVALAGTLGYLAGALTGWAVGRRGGRPLVERHGRWLHLDAERTGRRRGVVRAPRPRGGLPRPADAGRPVVHLDPGGVLDSPLAPYTLLTLAGSAIWCFGFAGVGWALGSALRPGPSRLHRSRGGPGRGRRAGAVAAVAGRAWVRAGRG
jgi:membrane protein DedA with SNARE-associated domain